MPSSARSVMMLAFFMLVLSIKTSWGDVSPGGMLYPRESETREVRSLDGIWRFRLSSDDPLEGFRDKWYDEDLTQTGETMPMPVPSSYNDITQDKAIRDHLGLVWYDRTFFVPQSWLQNKNRVWLRFGSVNYAAQVWVNGQLSVAHEIGHLPFQAEITSAVKFGEENRVTVVVDNTLLSTTVPQGSITRIQAENGSMETQSYSFDFFNYAGIHRSVHLYTTPVIYIDDIAVETDIESDGTGIIIYNITYGGNIEPASEPLVYVELLDQNNSVVVTDDGLGNLSGVLRVPEAKLWWPYLMDPNPGYMYTLKVRLQSKEWGSEDVYRQPVGIRSLAWNSKSVLINGKPIYLRGFGRHEDSDIRGKGLDLPLVVKDYNLLKWIGANAYRTSHYPYAEEIMDMADQLGIMIIDECPSVDTDIFSPTLLQKHTDSLGELIRRDKNRPSVIMWSVANEPRVQKAASETYFSYVADYVKDLDSSRPISMATARGSYEDKAAQFMDVIMFNRYNAWYSNPGKIMVIRRNVENDAESWHKKFNKPVIMSEYGADTMPGLHVDPSYIWSEEYQKDLLSEHFKAFDNLRKKGFFIGELIWNFADFKTAETYTRVGGNKKGIFTRNRQPKEAAYLVRQRYFALAAELDGVEAPDNLYNYASSLSKKHDKTEL
ncbi:beta-glucuronidase isoform X2 [Anabrus simplex]|uniref:beta-glucuronidase isoform X2 n=1 Tax=Anabrus simplex TaxID=316456 RepID=UPI0035A27543